MFVSFGPRIAFGPKRYPKPSRNHWLPKGLGRCKMVEFEEFPTFYGKFHFLLKKQKSFRDFRKKYTFSHPRGPCAQIVIKPMEFHTFLGVLGVFGHFLREINFLMKFLKSVEMRFCWRFLQFSQKMTFWWKPAHRKNTNNPKGILMIWRGRRRKIRISHKKHDFS